jgi:hypothetical protein
VRRRASFMLCARAFRTLTARGTRRAVALLPVHEHLYMKWFYNVGDGFPNAAQVGTADVRTARARAHV